MRKIIRVRFEIVEGTETWNLAQFKNIVYRRLAKIFRSTHTAIFLIRISYTVKVLTQRGSIQCPFQCLKTRSAVTRLYVCSFRQCTGVGASSSILFTLTTYKTRLRPAIPAPARGCQRTHGSTRDEGTEYNINITTRETEDGSKCGVEMECEQH